MWQPSAAYINIISSNKTRDPNFEEKKSQLKIPSGLHANTILKPPVVPIFTLTDKNIWIYVVVWI